MMRRAARNRASIPRGRGNSRSSSSGQAAARERTEICTAWSRVARAASSGAVTSSPREGGGGRGAREVGTSSPLLVRGALVRGGSLERFEVELLVKARQISFCGNDEQLVGDVHHDAIVSGGVLGDRGFELGGHESRVSCDVEDVIEARAEQIAGSGFEVKPSPDAASEGQQIGSAQSLGQPGVTGEDDAEQGPGVEVLAREDP